MTRVRKAVIPAAGLGTRFLPATKALPKEMLPVVDKPAIQYVVEEAVRAGLTDILIITGRNKRAIEDHFDRNFELEHFLETGGRHELLKEVQFASDLADIHYVRQRDPLGLGHAISVARHHVGDEPFAVLLADDLMIDDGALLRRMLDVHDRHGRSCIALTEVSMDEISSYGCVDPDPDTQHDDGLLEFRRVVEKPPRDEAPSNLAISGRYVLTPEIFDMLDRIEPGRGGELQLTDAIALLLKHQSVFGCICSEGRYDVGQKLDFLRATVELALDRPDLGADFEAWLRDFISRPAVIPLADAEQQILDAVTPLAPRSIPLRDARGLVLAEDVVADEPVPPFVNTGMDGYAVRAADTPGSLRVVGELPAGTAPTTPVGVGEAIRIMTGAPIPAGADAVVMVERTRTNGDTVDVEVAKLGEHIRPAGGDVEPGAVVFERGTVLTPAHLGVLASLDVHDVQCHPRPCVGVISTGDELVERGPLAPGLIRDSNRPMLVTLLEESGLVAIDGGIARDDEAVITAAIERAGDEFDVLLTSGAVSVGDYDFVKLVLERVAKDRGGTSLWAQVAIKPAKPLAFATIGTAPGTVPAFGLPGNPVSSRVSFELFARPALRKLVGRTDLLPQPVTATARSGLGRRADGKLHLDRVRVWVEGGRYLCERAGAQASNVLSGMAAANGLALIPDGEGIAAGAEVGVILL